MNPLLRKDQQSLSSILEEVLTVAKGHFAKMETLPPGQHIDDLPHMELPEKGIGAVGALNHFDSHYGALLANSAGPKYFGFVTGGATPAAVAGDWMVSAYDQNACGSSDSVAPKIELQTLQFLRNLFNLDDTYTGSFVTGATMANFVGLALGRQWAGEQQGVDISREGLSNANVPVLSGTPHSSILKSMAMLGLGRNTLTAISTLPDREAIDIGALEAALKATRGPVVVVANAGTVNTADFDDLESIGALKKKYPFWLHVDAAFGGFAAVTERYAHLLRGINAADSITIDAHKWLNVPYDAGMQFTKHPTLQLKVFQNASAYLGDPAESPDFFHYTPENSRRFRALPSWFTLMAYGKEGHREIVERNCDCAHFLGNALARSERFRLLAPVRMNVVCFTLNTDTPTTTDIRQFLAAIRDDGRVFFTPTLYRGVPAIRAAISNWQTNLTHIEETVSVLTEVWNKLAVQTIE